MLAFLQLLGMFVADLFRPRRRLEVENLFLRHQLNIALRGAPHRLRLRGSDRALLVWMTLLWPSLLGLSRVVQPDTILRWHRAGFRAIHGELLKLGIEVAQSTVSIYMVPRRDRPLQSDGR